MAIIPLQIVTLPYTSAVVYSGAKTRDNCAPVRTGVVIRSETCRLCTMPGIGASPPTPRVILSGVKRSRRIYAFY